MAEYLLSGRAENGRRVTRRVHAESADQAVAVFRAEGHDEVALHTDDVAAIYTRVGEKETDVTPREHVAFRDRGGFLHSTLFIARKLYAKSWWVSATSLATFVIRRAADEPWALIDYLCVTALLFPVVFAALSQVRSIARDYNRLQEAISWGRWEEALRRLPRVLGHVPPEEAAFSEAIALAGLGRLEEALGVIAPFSDDPRIPPWLYKGRLSGVYFAARKIDESLRCLEEAAAEAPENPTVLLDLASALVRYQRNVNRAAALLAAVKTHAISDVLLPVVGMTEGMIALERGQARDARETLQRAYRELYAFRRAAPQLGIFLDIIRGFLSIAHARCGEREAAEAEFRAAEPRLQALRMDELLDRCRREIR